MQAEAQTAMLKPVLEGLIVAYFKHELQTKQTVWVQLVYGGKEKSLQIYCLYSTVEILTYCLKVKEA